MQSTDRIPKQGLAETDPIGELYKLLSYRARAAIFPLYAETIGDLTKRSESKLLAVRGTGRKTVREIREVLAEHGLKLAEREADGIEPTPHDLIRVLRRTNADLKAQIARLQSRCSDLEGQLVGRERREYERLRKKFEGKRRA